MRVAYLINQYPMPSHTFIRREILALERRGVAVLRISIRGWGAQLADQEDQLERMRTRYVLRQGVPVLLLAFVRMFFRRPVRLMRGVALVWQISRLSERSILVHLVYLAQACRIEAWLRKEKIEHLHAHFGTNSAEVAMLVHILGGPRWSFTIHGPKEFNNVTLLALVEKLMRCAFVVAISSYGRSQLYRLLDYQHWPKVKVVHCGLETSFHAVAPGGGTSDSRRLTCVGRICEQKGQLLLVEAAQRLFSQGVQFELVLVGDGEMRADIEALIGRYRLQSCVRITGLVSNERVREEILAARALVLASFAEGLPMVIMEAMALRRPVISTFIAGIPELVLPGENGWLIPAGDVEALAQAMQACLNASAGTLVNMGQAAHDRVLARHSVETQADLLSDLFERAAG